MLGCDIKGADGSEKNESKVESTEVEAAVSAAQTRAEMGASMISKMRDNITLEGIKLGFNLKNYHKTLKILHICWVI